jgi:DNA repair protein RecN (Recombination protein N)
LELRDQLGQAYETVRSLRQTVDELRALSSSRERELDLLGFELAEIESVSPSEEEEQALGLERDRLRHLESLQAATHEGVQALAAEDGGGVAAVLAAAAQGLELAARVDPALQPLAARLQGIGYEAQDLAGELRSYHESLDLPPARLEEVEERLAVLSRLTRKHGGSIEAVLSHAEQCRERWAELEGAEVALEQAQDDLRRGEEELERLATELSRRREAAAPKLSAAVSERLAELAMPDAEFTVEVAPRPDGCGPAGADAVELLIAPNPGLPAGPLREIASGGELSRVMLALLSVAHGGEERSDQSLLVFDEVDAGIGGHTARAVGKHLRALAANRQILCITHLPQLAALAARHFTISKELGTVPAKTRVSVLDGDGVVGELVRMLGATENDRAASQHARELLRAA